MKMSTEDMPFKANTGGDPISMKQGYKKLADESTERFRDNQLPPSANLDETENGGFLGRTESVVSESTKVGKA